MLIPRNGSCLVAGREIADPMELMQGQLLQFGEDNLFRFNNPAQVVILHCTALSSGIKAQKAARRIRRITRSNDTRNCVRPCYMIVSVELFYWLMFLRTLIVISSANWALRGNQAHCRTRAITAAARQHQLAQAAQSMTVKTLIRRQRRWRSSRTPWWRMTTRCYSSKLKARKRN